MNLAELRVFATVAAEGGFSRAAGRLRLTQPAVSLAVKRLEEELGEPLIDRAERGAKLTEAGHVMRDYADRLLRLAGEAETAVRELRDLQRGRVLIGANEGSVHGLLPLIARFRQRHPAVHVDVRRVHARQMGLEITQGTLDFGVLTFQPAEAELATLVLAADELVLLVTPRHPMAGRKDVSLAEVGREVIIAHNDPSPTRERVLRTAERRHENLNIRVSLPSLDAIKRAVEMDLGVAILPRRCATTEIARRELVAVRVHDLGRRGHLHLAYRRSGARSTAAEAFLALAIEMVSKHEGWPAGAPEPAGRPAARRDAPSRAGGRAGRGTARSPRPRRS